MRYWLIALACLAASPALAQEFKGPVAGKWRSIIDGDTNQPNDECIAEQESLADFLDGDDTIDAGITCADFKFRREGRKIIGTYVCKEEGVTMASSVTLTGDVSSKYTSEIVTRFSPPPAPGYETVTTKASPHRRLLNAKAVARIAESEPDPATTRQETRRRITTTRPDFRRCSLAPFPDRVGRAARDPARCRSR